MEEINLRDLMRFYAKHWLLLVSAVILGAVIGLIYTGFIQQPMYRSEATVVVTGVERTSAENSVMINNYVNLFKTNRVLQPVIEKADYPHGVNVLRSNTTAKNEAGSDFITLTISTEDPALSKKLLESAIVQFGKEIQKLYDDEDVQLNSADNASLPEEAYNVHKPEQITLASLATLILAIILLFFAYDYRPNKNGEQATEKLTKNNNTNESNYTPQTASIESGEESNTQETVAPKATKAETKTNESEAETPTAVEESTEQPNETKAS